MQAILISGGETALTNALTNACSLRHCFPRCGKFANDSLVKSRLKQTFTVLPMKTTFL